MARLRTARPVEIEFLFIALFSGSERLTYRVRVNGPRRFPPRDHATNLEISRETIGTARFRFTSGEDKADCDTYS